MIDIFVLYYLESVALEPEHYDDRWIMVGLYSCIEVAKEAAAKAYGAKESIYEDDGFDVHIEWRYYDGGHLGHVKVDHGGASGGVYFNSIYWRIERQALDDAIDIKTLNRIWQHK